MVRPYIKHHLMVRPHIKHHLMVRALYKTPFNGAPFPRLLCAEKCGGRGERRELPLRDAPKWQEQGVRTLDFRLEVRRSPNH